MIYLAVPRAVRIAVLLSVLCLVCGAAFAQEPRNAVITLTAPTQYTDGTDILPGTVVSYRVYQGTCGGQKSLVGEITETTTTITSGLEAGQHYGWEVTAVVNGEESARSNEGCKSFRVPQTVTITVQ